MLADAFKLWQGDGPQPNATEIDIIGQQDQNLRPTQAGTAWQAALTCKGSKTYSLMLSRRQIACPVAESTLCKHQYGQSGK
jgi:hypothetical protein